MSATKRWLAVPLAVGMVFSLSACSFITGLFPDKQKQYRYSSNIPELEIPPDLSSSTIEGAKGGGGASAHGRGMAADTEGTARSGNGGDEEEIPKPKPPQATKKRAQTDKSAAARATLAQNAQDVPLIEIGEPFPEAWNDVNRALGRMEVEVTDQNRSDGVYYVIYGGDTRKHEDGGFWQDMKSLFSSAPANGDEYRIKIEEKADSTDIYVLDRDGKAVTQGAGFELLKRLHEKMQTLDQAETEKSEAEQKK